MSSGSKAMPGRSSTIQFKSEREMQQVDDLLEKSKNLLRSIHATPKKAPPPKMIVEDPHEKEMAELLALERQLELEISQLENH